MTILDLIQSATASLQDDTITDEHSDQRFAATSLQTGVAAFIFDRGGSNGGNGGTDGETPPDPTENNDSDLSDVTD
ncbi:MAG: hypothetical protein CMM93_03240, partial [Rickettsiales bacterium]|nr:hypothetical protein [Rickettsiales bacterium]